MKVCRFVMPHPGKTRNDIKYPRKIMTYVPSPESPQPFCFLGLKFAYNIYSMSVKGVDF